jgi:hypothetical protein
MRLIEWSAVAPTREAAGPKVLAVAQAAIATLGADADADVVASFLQVVCAAISGRPLPG